MNSGLPAHTAVAVPGAASPRLPVVSETSAGDWRELDRERVALAEAGLGPPVFYVRWRCDHALRRPIDETKVHWHKPIPQMVRPKRQVWGTSENWRGQVA